ncbi:putative amino-acid permease protein YxeN [Bacillus safensis]|uniref:amino acid ABC transporter permease n=1 Tax=Bacillus TaxID=1386 RepID=UPI0006A921F8|nr:amino acid ABC transporter permease [Bacillus safensis]CUB22510.1 putative amino-acid permease protein YxeN [Bacillus safensis]
MQTIDIPFAIDQVPHILKGVPFTLLIALVSMAVSLVIGSVFAFIRLFRIPVLRQLVTLYVSFFRGTPLIVQLFAFFYGLPFVLSSMSVFGLTFHPDMVSPLAVALITFSLHSAAHLTEVVRSALLAVDKGQLEAAKIVGMTTRQAMLRIILPQAFVVALPNLGNQLVQLLKATSLSFTIGVLEIMGISRIIANDGYQFLETYLVSALIYWLLSIFFELAFTLLEKRVSVYGRTLGR